ncbi:hypothetical protein DL771_008599 [Monosporascus sp. 5C6A]|nr:hypothetical protein DL771_008599 [Monosporascus sp. 5C6A]
MGNSSTSYTDLCQICSSMGFSYDPDATYAPTILEKDRNLKDAEDPRGEIFLRPATGTYRTDLDVRDVCDVFYGGHPTSPIRGHVIVQRQLTGQPHPEPRPASSLENIDFQQIGRVVHELSFLTLSYVRGEKVAKFNMRKSNAGNFVRRHEPGALRSELHALPKAIQDAWKVTQELGERFLWSVLTIVAVSGGHADGPLPGVRPGRRTAIQPVELAAPWVFTGEMLSLDWVLGLTRYEKRAWTFQERLLCKRRLYLSDWQVYFQCDQVRHDLLVSELCRREVGEGDNILSAFAGMVSYMENLGTGLIEVGTPLPNIDHALSWAPVGRLKKRPISNSEGLPSWSWVAWHGNVRHIWNHHGPMRYPPHHEENTSAAASKIDSTLTFDERGEIVEIALDYERPTTDQFRDSRFSLVLLSKFSTVYDGSTEARHLCRWH